jgi:hypothetical protein
MNQNDFVQMNVGGKIFELQKSTLLRYKNSIFPGLFSNSELLQDKNKILFLDRPPNLFEEILNHLRQQNNIIKFKSIEYTKIIENEIEFYGLQTYLHVQKSFQSESTKNQDEIPSKLTNIIFNINLFHIENFIFGSCVNLFAVFWILKTVYLCGGIPSDKINLIFQPLYYISLESLILTFIHIIRDSIQFKRFENSYSFNIVLIIFTTVLMNFIFNNVYNYANNKSYYPWIWYFSIPICIDFLFCIYSINKMLKIHQISDIFLTMESLMIHFGPLNVLFNLISFPLYLDGHFHSNYWIKIPASIHSLFGSLFSFKTAHECLDWQGKLLFSAIGVFLILSSWTLIGLYLEVNPLFSFGPIDLWLLFSFLFYMVKIV